MIYVIRNRIGIVKHRISMLYRLMFYIFDIILDMPRHHIFTYANYLSIPTEYFDIAEKTLDNGYMYMVLSDTGSSTSELIKMYTNARYAHISLSFDEALDTMVSYNSDRNSCPGLNHEKISYLKQKEDAKLLVLSIAASHEQKKRILDAIRTINEEGSSFNPIAFFAPSFKLLPNIYICSQFVYSMLTLAGLNYFNANDKDLIHPMDFIEKDELQIAKQIRHINFLEYID